jgi:hypothetical protein
MAAKTHAVTTAGQQGPEHPIEILRADLQVEVVGPAARATETGFYTPSVPDGAA